MTREQRETCICALGEYGKDRQIDMCIEECAELINALCKFRRGRNKREDVVTEIADVRIMCEQMALLFGDKAVDDEIERKLKRLNERMGLETTPLHSRYCGGCLCFGNEDVDGNGWCCALEREVRCSDKCGIEREERAKNNKHRKDKA